MKKLIMVLLAMCFVSGVANAGFIIDSKHGLSYTINIVDSRCWNCDECNGEVNDDCKNMVFNVDAVLGLISRGVELSLSKPIITTGKYENITFTIDAYIGITSDFSIAMFEHSGSKITKLNLFITTGIRLRSWK